MTNTIGSLIQLALLSVACLVLLGSSFARIVRKSGEASLTFQAGAIAVMAGCLQILSTVATGQPINPWHITIALCGGAILVYVRDKPEGGVNHRRPRTMLALLATGIVLSYVGITTASRTWLGDTPAYRVDSLRIDPGKVGQVDFKFHICGQKLRTLHTRYYFVIATLSDTSQVVRFGELHGDQFPPGPKRCGSFWQPIGPINAPGEYLYTFKSLEDGKNYPFDPIKPRLTVTE